MKKFLTTIIAFFLFSPMAFAAIAVDNSLDCGNQAGAGTMTCSYATSGTDRFLFVAIYSGSNPSLSSITYNAVSLTNLSNISNAGSGFLQTYYLTNPANITNTLSITHGAGIYVVVASYTGVDQSTSTENLNNQTTGTAATETNIVNVSSTNSWLLGGVVEQNAATGFTAATGTLRVSQALAKLSIADSNGALAIGSRSLAWTINSGTPAWLDGVFALRPAVAAVTTARHKSPILISPF